MLQWPWALMDAGDVQFNLEHERSPLRLHIWQCWPGHSIGPFMFFLCLWDDKLHLVWSWKWRHYRPHVGPPAACDPFFPLGAPGTGWGADPLGSVQSQPSSAPAFHPRCPHCVWPSCGFLPGPHCSDLPSQWLPLSPTAWQALLALSLNLLLLFPSF